MRYLVLILFLMSSNAFSIELLTSDIQTRIENKQFIGGVDEEDLRVQVNKQSPYRVLLLRKVRQGVYETVLKEASEATDDETPETKTN